MLLNNCFHTDDLNHDHVPFSSKGFPYACIIDEVTGVTGGNKDGRCEIPNR